MRRPREAVDAAVLTAPEGINRLLEGDIGRIIARDDRAGLNKEQWFLTARQRTGPWGDSLP